MRARGPLSVLLADDHPLFADSLEALFSTERGLKIVGRAENGEEAVKLAEKLRPNVVLMDISMPVLNGFEAARRIRETAPDTCIVFLTGSNSPADLAEARAAGAAGYVTKDRIATELVDAIYAAAASRK